MGCDLLLSLSHLATPQLIRDRCRLNHLTSSVGGNRTVSRRASRDSAISSSTLGRRDLFLSERTDLKKPRNLPFSSAKRHRGFLGGLVSCWAGGMGDASESRRVETKLSPRGGLRQRREGVTRQEGGRARMLSNED